MDGWIDDGWMDGNKEGRKEGKEGGGDGWKGIDKWKVKRMYSLIDGRSTDGRING